MIPIQKLTAGSVDYAGLFPPASLPMSETVANFLGYRRDRSRAMLGRLVVTANRLEELRQAVNALPVEPEDAVDRWQLSVLVPVDAETEYRQLKNCLNQIEIFNKRFSEARPISTLVDSLELKISSGTELAALAGLFPSDFNVFFEIDCVSDPKDAIEALARLRQTSESNSASPNGDAALGGRKFFAKIRSGSVIADQIPTVEQVSRFVTVCARYLLPFKATAGLHHPLRNEYRLTYEADSACGTMHGFINLFVASLFAYEYQLSEQEIAQILQEREPSNFHFEDDRIQWRQFTISLDRIDALRQVSIQSFGSCSFVEPTEELCELFHCQLS